MPHTSQAPRRNGKAHSELAASRKDAFCLRVSPKGALCDCGVTETRRLPGDARGRPRDRARTGRAGVYAGRTVAASSPFRTQPLRCLGNRQGHRGSRPGLTSLRPRRPHASRPHAARHSHPPPAQHRTRSPSSSSSPSTRALCLAAMSGPPAVPPQPQARSAAALSR